MPRVPNLGPVAVALVLNVAFAECDGDRGWNPHQPASTGSPACPWSSTVLHLKPVETGSGDEDLVAGEACGVRSFTPGEEGGEERFLIGDSCAPLVTTCGG